MTAPVPATATEPPLAEVLPSALSALGVAGEPNTLALAPARCIVVLLVDGLGWELLRRNGEHAPFLSSLAGRPLRAGFPTTTAASITSFGTGAAAGAHGITGYITRAGLMPEPVNWLTWRGAYSGRDVLGEQVPETIQALDTAFERAEKAGVPATVISAAQFRDSGLTRAALRGGSYVASFTAADTATEVAVAARARPGLIYCYISDLDLVGHIRGCRSAAWRAQLEYIDVAARMIADRLPDGASLLVVADHGMVDIPEPGKIDYDAAPDLSEGVEMIAGEPRARYLHVPERDREPVRERWSAQLGERAAILTREDAIARGWFGSQVSTEVRARIGDLIVVGVDDVAIVRRRAESRSAMLVGHHGALSLDEQLVPLLTT